MFSGAAEQQLPLTNHFARSTRWRISLGTASAHLQWYHKSLSSAASQHRTYLWYCWWWLQSLRGIDGLDISHAGRWSCLAPHKLLPQQQPAFGQGCLRMHFGDRLPLSILPSIVLTCDVGISHQNACLEHVSPDGFAVQWLCFPLPITICAFNWRLLGSIQEHIESPLLCCSIIFSLVSLNLHCGMDYMNLLFLLLMGISCQLFSLLGLCRHPYFLFRKSILLHL